MNDGQKLASRTTIPVGDMAKASLEAIFPNLTKEQCQALREDKPLPPSPEWVNPGETEVISKLRAQYTEQGIVLRQKIRLEGLLDFVISRLAGEALVTAIMVFGDKARVRRARKAVNQFVAQSYENKQLVIVNATDTPITNRPHPQIKELVFPAGIEPLTGTMRNYAIQHADGDYLYPHWDDDDVYDRHLLYVMMSARRANGATLLSTQCRIDINNMSAYMHHEPRGIPNTMLVPKSELKYPDCTGSEDTIFWSTHYGVRTFVIDNKAWPANTLKMCIHAGDNVTPVEEFMVDHAGPQWFGRFMVSPSEAAHIQDTLATFGFEIVPKDPATLVPT